MSPQRLPQRQRQPFILRTADMGQTWQSVVGEGLPANDPVEVIREDPVNPRLLYTGTHFGLFASFDGGAKLDAPRRLPGGPSGRSSSSIRARPISSSRPTAAASAFWMTLARCAS